MWNLWNYVVNKKSVKNVARKNENVSYMPFTLMANLHAVGIILQFHDMVIWNAFHLTGVFFLAFLMNLRPSDCCVEVYNCLNTKHNPNRQL